MKPRFSKAIKNAVIAAGESILEAEWRRQSEESLAQKRYPIWYFIKRKEGVWSVQNVRPFGQYLECIGPRAFTEKEIDQERSIIEGSIERERKKWTTFQKVEAVFDSIIGNGGGGSYLDDLRVSFKKLRERFEYRNLFESESKDIRGILNTLPRIRKSRQRKREPEPLVEQVVDDRIPWAGTESELIKALSALAADELLYPDFIRDNDSVLGHFRVGSSETRGRKTAGKIMWRGKIAEILALFTWMEINMSMNEMEARNSLSLICTHFSRRGKPMSVGSLRATRSGETHAASRKMAQNRIDGLLKACTVSSAISGPEVPQLP